MNLLYFVGWCAARAVFATYFRWRVFHPERVPAQGPAILAANHASYLDPPLIGSALRRDIHYLARESLFRFAPFGAVLRGVNAVPVDREGGGAAGLRAILDRLAAGSAVLLFPEGTRTHDGQLQPVRAGIGLTIIRSSCPVVPVRVFGTYEAWGRHRRFPRPHPVAVKFGWPVDFAAAREEAKTCSKTRLKAIYREAAEQVMSAIARLEPCADVNRFGA